MSSKTEEYLVLAQRTANGLTRYWESWTDYLTTASRLYKYSFPNQLMIYAQRPDATACADYDVWNNRMNRYVRRGSKGIALLDESSGYPRLHYVFDVSDTGMRHNSRDPERWELNDDLFKPVSDMLVQKYGISHERLSQQLVNIAEKLVNDYRVLNHGVIQVDRSDGSSYTARVEHLDDYHFDLGEYGNVYHICQFGEMMERTGSTAYPEIQTQDEQGAWELGGKGYLAIQSCEDGWDYTLYHSDYSVMDGGQIDAPELTIQEVREQILEAHHMEKGRRVLKDYDLIMAFTNEPRVSYRDGRYHVFDGQNTIEARIACNGGHDLPILCKVFHGLSKKDEALLFAVQTGISTDLTAGERLRADIVAEDEDACAFVAATEATGATFALDGIRAEWKIYCIRSAYYIYKNYGSDIYQEALKIIVEAWWGDSDSFLSGILHGVTRFVAMYRDEYSRERLIARLSTVHPKTITKNARKDTGNTADRHMKQILEIYNGSSRSLSLPIKR